MTLAVRFWGVRGSVPSPGAHTVRYGGNTPCVEVRTPRGDVLVLDAGTGIRALGNALVRDAGDAPVSAHLFVSHTHWDHIQGLPFFAPLYRAGDRITVWSAPTLGVPVERALREQMSSGVFPVPFERVRAQIEFRELGDAPADVGGVCLRATRVRHPGGAVGFRVDGGGARGTALVYIPDNELDAGAPVDAPPGWRDALLSFARDAAVLIHDATYDGDDYPAHAGWGHSRAQDAVHLAIEAGVRRLVLFHHLPDRGDDDVDRLLDASRTLAAREGSALEVEAAAEGMTLAI
ncbi:MAG TPA: MBL fold metallo-hydrolase [Gemmatimonadaceae bacterium]|nr:MBL fold metallo-hydrolase [Gemmatimonadaceae bacterium]